MVKKKEVKSRIDVARGAVRTSARCPMKFAKLRKCVVSVGGKRALDLDKKQVIDGRGSTAEEPR